VVPVQERAAARSLATSGIDPRGLTPDQWTSWCGALLVAIITRAISF
jgi:hypothetical protein